MPANNITFIFCFFLFVGALPVYAQSDNNKKNDEYYEANFFRNEDYVYHKNIKTVLLHQVDLPLTPAIIHLNSSEKLKLSFDDLDGNSKTYSYTLIHCDADWKTSNIMSSDYLSGYPDEPITDYTYSFNTLQKYTHYNQVFPTDNMKILASGNYIIKVFADYNPEKYILSRRFMVVEDRVNIIGRVKESNIISDRNYKQQIDFSVFTDNYPVSNPYSDLKVVLIQNNRWDNTVSKLKPTFVKDRELVYDFSDDNVFAGGNEFRRFDIKSLRFITEFVRDIVKDSGRYSVLLYPGEKRAYKRYVFDNDINGKFLIKVQEGSNSEAEADYIFVNFLLPYDAAEDNGSFYVFGQLSDWQCKDEFKMRYNTERFAYESTVYLKQGYYNYEYVFLKNGDPICDDTYVEGSHFETENDYSILVYHRPAGRMYDLLVGLRTLNSLKNKGF